MNVPIRCNTTTSKHLHIFHWSIIFTLHLFNPVHRKVEYVNFPALPLSSFDFNVEIDYNVLRKTPKKKFDLSILRCFLKRVLSGYISSPYHVLLEIYALFYIIHTFFKTFSQKRKCVFFSSCSYNMKINSSYIVTTNCKCLSYI